MEELARESIRSLSVLAKPARGTEAPRLGSLGAVFIMLKSALGAGLLNFPWAFQRAGGINRAITVELFFITKQILLSNSNNKTTMFILLKHTVCVCVCVCVLSVCVSLYETVSGEKEMPYHWYTDQSFALFIMCLIIILPLSIPKEISIQKYTRYTIVIYTETVFIAPQRPLVDLMSLKLFCCRLNSWGSVLSVVPTICFGFQVTLFNKKISHWVFISVMSMIFCLLIYTLTGVFGFLTFGPLVASDILMSYPGDDVVMIIARLLFGISIFTIYPIILLLGRSVVLALVLRYRERVAVVTVVFERRCRVGLTVLWIGVTLLIAVYVPDMSDVISVIGGISAFFIFIFPGEKNTHTHTHTPSAAGV
uniref:Solute carrier family 38 member 8b n=1 Tax=Astyanax mexicanus TaxID=7994 RepID=A0A8B9GYQ6_ASTMX